MINSPSTSDLNKHQTPEQKITTKKIKQAILKGKIQLGKDKINTQTTLRILRIFYQIKAI